MIKPKSRIDPVAFKKAQKVAQKTAGKNSFKVVAAEWFEVKMADKSKSYRERFMRVLENNLYPSAGHRPIFEISPLEPIDCEQLFSVYSQCTL